MLASGSLPCTRRSIASDHGAGRHERDHEAPRQRVLQPLAEDQPDVEDLVAQDRVGERHRHHQEENAGYGQGRRRPERVADPRRKIEEPRHRNRDETGHPDERTDHEHAQPPALVAVGEPPVVQGEQREADDHRRDDRRTRRTA